MTLRAVQLDFLQPGRRASGSGVVLLAAGVVAAFVVLLFHGELLGEAQQLEAQVAKLERRSRGLAPVDVRVEESVQQEIRRANEVIDQLALPWDRLFRAVESAASDRVALRGIAPDAKAGTVQISAETADPEAMFDYVRKLEQQSGLSQVYLLQHQRERRNTARPIRFLVSASWMQRPN
jgi:Tfp pilus assembly protein PilN